MKNGFLFDVVDVKPDDSYHLTLTFENSERRYFDMNPYLDRKPWRNLKAKPFFLRASIEHGTVIWPGEIDIDPETLYEQSIPCSEQIQTEVSENAIV